MASIIENYIQTCGIGGESPKYNTPLSTDDKVAIPFCEIKVWAYQKNSGSAPDLFNCPKDCLRLTEVGSIEISKSYKKIIQTAVIKIPRGTIVNRRIKDLDEKGQISTGNHTEDKSEKSMGESTCAGDTIVPSTYSYKDTSESTLPVNASRSDDGVMKITRDDDDSIVSPNDFQTGNRIEIRMKYAYSDDEYNDFKKGKKKGDLVFSGFIHKCSVSSPLTIQCEDLMSIMKKIPCPNLVAKADYTVNDFLEIGGKFDLIKNSGIKLDPKTQSTKINVGKIGLTKELVVADIIDEWSKCGLYAFINEEALESDDKEKRKEVLRVGRVYTGSSQAANMTKMSGKINVIQFDWDVAVDNLKVNNIDKNFLAIECHAQTNDGKFWKLTVRKNPDPKNGDKPYLVNNVKKPKTKKAAKNKQTGAENGQNMEPTSIPTLGLDTYTIVPYFSSKHGIKEDELAEEGWAYYQKYNLNGISGSLTLFGDRSIRPTDTVALIDPMHPERNGYYFVEESNINFSVSSGYRVEIKLPYKLGKYSKPVIVNV